MTWFTNCLLSFRISHFLTIHDSYLHAVRSYFFLAFLNLYSTPLSRITIFILNSRQRNSLSRKRTPAEKSRRMRHTSFASTSATISRDRSTQNHEPRRKRAVTTEIIFQASARWNPRTEPTHRERKYFTVVVKNDRTANANCGGNHREETIYALPYISASIQRVDIARVKCLITDESVLFLFFSFSFFFSFL